MGASPYGDHVTPRRSGRCAHPDRGGVLAGLVPEGALTWYSADVVWERPGGTHDVSVADHAGGAGGSAAAGGAVCVGAAAAGPPVCLLHAGRDAGAGARGVRTVDAPLSWSPRRVVAGRGHSLTGPADSANAGAGPAEYGHALHRCQPQHAGG